MKFRIGDERKNQTMAFNSIMPDIINDLDLGDTFFIENLRSKWEAYVGTILSVHSFPERIFRKTLFVTVDHPVYSNDLSLHSDRILSSIKNDFGSEFIFNIKFELKKNRYRK